MNTASACAWRDEALEDWLRGQDLNLGPSGYEPDELPGCSTPRQEESALNQSASGKGALSVHPAANLNPDTENTSKNANGGLHEK